MAGKFKRIPIRIVKKVKKPSAQPAPAAPKAQKPPRKVVSPPPIPVIQPLTAAQTVSPANQAAMTLTDKHISSILSDRRFLTAIPCLASGQSTLKNIPRTCGSCSRKRSTARKDAMRQIRSCIAGLRGESQKEFKKLLGAGEVTIVLSKKQMVTI